MPKDPNFVCRLPTDVKAFIASQSEKYGSSQNSEIVRAVRERMQRVNREEAPVSAGE
jgi:hypothetical protein